MLFERKPLGDILKENPELLVRGNWLCLNIETRGTAWPTKAQRLLFEGREIWVMPHTESNFPGLAFNCPADLDRDEGWALLHRALSYIAWTQDSGAMVNSMSGGSLPNMIGRAENSGGIMLRETFDFTEVREPPDKRAKLSLALMREGRGINHPAYAFLSFFRVVEIAIPNGKKRGEWVASQVENLRDHRAREALEKLKACGVKDVGVHLFESGRCAIAHAKADPIINPDDPRDARRLGAELPIMQALAVSAIETHLGVQTEHTIWKEHLYELAGWRRTIGHGAIEEVVAGTPPQDGQTINLPTINIRLRSSDPFAPLEGMTPLWAAHRDRSIELRYQSSDALVEMAFRLDFGEERLIFDVENGLFARDDGSVAAARDHQDIDRFFRDYFLNGELQMWDSETGDLLSRCDPFIPVNIIVNVEGFNAGIDRWNEVIAEREREAAGES
jgi:hypothetical protein